MKKKIVAFIPIKLNNERLPNKNTKSFTNGEPLCSYILHTLSNSEMIDEIYVFCSDTSISTYLPEKVNLLIRNKNLDTSSTKVNEICASFAQKIDADIYIMTHVTSPFISLSSIEKGIDAVVNKEYSSSLSVKKLQDFMWKDGVPFNYDLENIPRTQDLKPIFLETSGFYIYRKDVILKQNRRVSNNTYLVEVSEVEAIDIDTLEDFELADAVYNYHKNVKY